MAAPPPASSQPCAAALTSCRRWPWLLSGVSKQLNQGLKGRPRRAGAIRARTDWAPGQGPFAAPARPLSRCFASHAGMHVAGHRWGAAQHRGRPRLPAAHMHDSPARRLLVPLAPAPLGAVRQRALIGMRRSAARLAGPVNWRQRAAAPAATAEAAARAQNAGCSPCC